MGKSATPGLAALAEAKGSANETASASKNFLISKACSTQAKRTSPESLIDNGPWQSVAKSGLVERLYGRK